MNKVYIFRNGELWNGRNWTVVVQFAKKYRVKDALDIIAQRFYRMEPRPIIRGVGEFSRVNKKTGKPKSDLDHTVSRAYSR